VNIVYLAVKEHELAQLDVLYLVVQNFASDRKAGFLGVQLTGMYSLSTIDLLQQCKGSTPNFACLLNFWFKTSTSMLAMVINK